MPVAVAGHAAAPVQAQILVAGGTTWENGEKLWLRQVWTYDAKADRWEERGMLPRPTAYAVGIAGDNLLYLVGGSDGQRALRECYGLRIERGHLRFETLPSLPEGRVYAAGARIGRWLYVVGGTRHPDRLEEATSTLLALNLERIEGGWQTLAPLPGPARFNCAAASCGGALYVFGGAYLARPGTVENLSDAWCFDPKAKRWEHLPKAPFAARGWTAIAGDAHTLLLFGGYTASAKESEGKPDHFGFTDRILRYHTVQRTYDEVGRLPCPTIGAVPALLEGTLFLFGGEPAKRQRGAWTWRLESVERLLH